MVVAAWEDTQPNVLICIAEHGDVSYEWAVSFADLWQGRPVGTGRRKLGPYVLDMARENGAVDAVNLGYKWVFFLDSDVIVPPDAVQRLLAHNKPIVSGFYARRHAPVHPLLLRRDGGGQIGLVTGYTPGALAEVDLCPTGCLLISTEVFKHVPRPWFFYTDGRVIDIGGGMPVQLPNGMSEDYYFSTKSKTFGYQSFVDTGLKCAHKGPFNVVPRDDGGFEVNSETPNP